MTPMLSFFGGAGTVTGSKYLLRVKNRQVLLDAGLFQGLKELRLRNWANPPFSPAALDAVVLSHAHIDHSGFLPRLVREQFKGDILCTSATADLLHVMLLDSAGLQEEEAAHANKMGYSKHRPALPLYTTEDAEKALKQVHSRPYNNPFHVTDQVKALFRRAGHILGSATVELEISDSEKPLRLVFSGDLGRWNQPILRDPELVPEADILLIESTYGNRVHPVDPAKELARIVRESAARGGALLIPAFAVGRTQLLLYMLRELELKGEIPSLPVFVDSPMAANVTDIYCRHPEEYDLDMKKLMNKEGGPFSTKQFHPMKSIDESKSLNRISGAVIIISSSGMATGGRILHHLKLRISDSRTTILLVGYQAAGTRGRSLQDGARTIRMYGENIPVRAKVEMLDGLSAHADENEILKWLSGFKKPPRQTFVVHGEPEAAESLTQTIRKHFQWNVRPAVDGETVDLKL